jgi:hypothetical protein
MKKTILKTVSLVLISTYLISCKKIEVEPSQEPTPLFTIYDCEASQELYDSLAFNHQINGVAWMNTVDVSVKDSLALVLIDGQNVIDELLAEMISNGCF